MELWDAYNENFEKIPNVSLIRGEAIPAGMYHLVCDVIVRHTDGSYLLMQRDRRKPFGGMWEATAGGSALRNETPLDCAVRELWEETGIRSDRLTEVGRVRDRDTFFVEFLCVTDWPKDNITLQEGETIAYRWVDRGALLSMRKSELVTERMQTFLDELQQGKEGDRKRT
ncbi:MAG: NUDIX hydrolase [Clostridia bacterium]|nr:NUDIX hydrolase [Clostridia bacterium]